MLQILHQLPGILYTFIFCTYHFLNHKSFKAFTALSHSLAPPTKAKSGNELKTCRVPLPPETSSDYERRGLPLLCTLGPLPTACPLGCLHRHLRVHAAIAYAVLILYVHVCSASGTHLLTSFAPSMPSAACSGRQGRLQPPNPPAGLLAGHCVPAFIHLGVPSSAKQRVGHPVPGPTPPPHAQSLKAQEVPRGLRVEVVCTSRPCAARVGQSGIRISSQRLWPSSPAAGRYPLLDEQSGAAAPTSMATLQRLR